jgi:enoyl-CoA hydratase/carnithine racemase
MAGTYGTLTLSQHEGGVWLVVMNGGDNRVNADFLSSWHRVLDVVEASKGAAALVSTGNDKFYSNGLDLEYMSKLEPAV